MANTITNVVPQLLAQGVLALRQQAMMVRLVTRDYEGLAQQKGNVINIPIPSAQGVRSVTAGVAYVTSTDFSPTTVAVTLDRWQEAAFHLSDNDMLSVVAGTIPMQASEAVKALANDIDSFILSQHVDFYGAAGAAGTTPFATTINVASTARKLLNKQLAPLTDRRFVLDPEAEANALVLANIIQFDQRGDTGGIINGVIGTKLGAPWYMDQNMPTFTPGTGWVTGYSAATIAAAVGDSTIRLTNATASGTVKVGDIFTFSSQQYVLTAAATASATVQFVVSFYPPLLAAIATDAAITVIATAYTVNLAFHRDALAWCSRPLQDVQAPGSIIESVTDPVSGVALRLEFSRQYKLSTFSYDYLGGCNTVRRELGAKILG